MQFHIGVSAVFNAILLLAQLQKVRRKLAYDFIFWSIQQLRHARLARILIQPRSAWRSRLALIIKAIFLGYFAFLDKFI